jgi:hypothetical protein
MGLQLNNLGLIDKPNSARPYVPRPEPNHSMCFRGQ